MSLPHGRRFAFSIIDDTDVATVANVSPVYDLLEQLGMRTTKTVWPLAWHGRDSDFAESETLEDAHYVEFVRDLQRRGFEIASHGATMESSARADTQRALQRFVEVFGDIPRVYANHANNRENLYWGVHRLDNPMVRAAYQRALGVPDDYFQGHDPHSEHWWGDLCRQHHDYVRNLTFPDLNVLRHNPTLPYHDPSRPLVKWWFSATDAEDADEFVQLFTPRRIARLEAEGGVCILATHLGKGYAPGGRIRTDVATALRALAERDGWFVPVGTLLDHLRGDAGMERVIPPAEWRRMQLAWAFGLVRRRLASRWNRRKRSAAS